MTAGPCDEPIAIRRPVTPTDYYLLQDVQRAAWALADSSYIVPVATLVGAEKHGGLVLGAFREDGTAVGMSFAFLGRIRGRLGLYSQLTGIRPEYQGRGVGTLLKLAQRDFALREGIELIAWAFDPLQIGNARFNLAKLGATCGHYYPDLYGPRVDRLNRGVPTDRLLAEWEVSRPPRARLEADSLPTLARVLRAEPDADGGLEPVAVTIPPDARSIGLEIPSGMTSLRESDPARALRWLLAARKSFEAVFALGYRAVDFLDPPSEPCDRGVYVLTRDRD